MKIIFYVILTVLVCLAAASGLAKIILAPQEVTFFSEFGVSNAALIAFGVVQLLGAILLVWSRTRVIGAVVVAVSFLISAGFLLQAGSTVVALITLAFIALLGVIVKLTPYSTRVRSS